MTKSQILLHPAGGLTSPMDIPNLLQWYDIGQEVGFNDNDTLEYITDWSGNGWTMRQSTEAVRPVYKTNIVNGRAVSRYTGTQYIATARSVSHGIGKGDFTWALVLGNMTLPGNIFACGNGSYAPCFMVNGGFWGDYWGGYRVFLTPATAPNFVIVEYTRTNLLNELYVNGVKDSRLLDGDRNMEDSYFAIGCSGYVSETWLGDIAEVMVFRKYLSSAERSWLTSYLKKKYDIK